MIIHFDTKIKWIPTAGDLDDTTPRRYYAAAPPYLVVLVLREGVLDAIDSMAENMNGLTFDCSVGNHANDAPFGFTLPRYSGYQHTKITVHKLVENGRFDETLSAILAGAPQFGRDDLGRYDPADGEEFAILLPTILAVRLRQLAGKLGTDVDSFCWEILLDYVAGEA